jgi:transglutaminase-like putative cysteine protease
MPGPVHFHFESGAAMLTLALLALSCTAEPAPIPTRFKLDPAQPYSAKLGNSVEYQVEFQAIVTAPMNTQVLKVWVPVPPSDLAQSIDHLTFHTFPTDHQPTLYHEPVFGNTFAYFEFQNPNGAQIISQKFTASVSELRWAVEPSEVLPVAEWPRSFEPFRRGESLIQVDETYKKLAEEISGGKGNPSDRLNAITDWVQTNLTYDHSNTSLVASSAHALTKKRGDCSDYHGLCSSLGRSLGVPTRVTYGLHLFPKNLPCHCKLEAYLPPYGWVSFDVSETQRLMKRIDAETSLTAAEKSILTKAATTRLRQGFRDNTWLLMTTGTDYELAPKASARVPLVATIYAEADGKPLPAPDPADPSKHEFAWMTSHRYTASQPTVYPFKDWKTLK